MSSKTLKCLVVGALFVGLFLGGWFVIDGKDIFFKPPAEKWTIKPIKWFENGGSYAVDVDLKRTSGEGHVNFSTDDYESWCAMVVANPPEHPTVAKPKIYRVGIRVELQGGTYTRRYWPVTVHNGTCRAYEFGGFAYFSYPAPIEQWLANPMWIGKSEGKSYAIVRFEWFGQAVAPIDEFDPLFACSAMMSDPPYTWSMLHPIGNIERMHIIAFTDKPERMQREFEVSILNGVCTLLN